MAETLPTVTISAVDGDNVINHPEASAAAGVPLAGTVSGLAAGATFDVSVSDGAFSNTYTATVDTAGTGWTATIPEADAITLPNGTATLTAQVTDAYGNQSTLATDQVTVAETLPTVTISPVDGDNVINYAEAHAVGGVPLSGAVSGLAAGATFSVSVTDGAFSKDYVATVNAAGNGWSATLTEADAITLANGTATVTAIISPTIQASENVVIAEKLPAVTINKTNGDNIIDNRLGNNGDDDDNHCDDDDRDSDGCGGGQGPKAVQLCGTLSGVAPNRTFQVMVTDAGFDKGDNRLGDNGDYDDDDRDSDGCGGGQGPKVVQLGGTVSGVAPNSTFQVVVTDAGFDKTYTATVNAAGNAWTATIPAADVAALPNGTAVVSATVVDAYGNMSLPAVQDVTVEGTTPDVLSVTAQPDSGDLDAGKTVAITLHMNEAVVVTGSPTLQMNDCGVATFDKADSTATTLVFDYVVASGQNTNDLKTTGVTLGCGASIADSSGDPANLAGAAANLGIVVDTTPPKVKAVTTSPACGEAKAGQTVVITLTMDEAVKVVGTPTLSLNDGGVAIYDMVHSTATTLVFDYTVAAGQNTSDLAVTGVDLPHRSLIEGLAGDQADLSGALSCLGIQIDTIAPTVKSVIASPANADLGAGKSVTLTLKMSEAVTVTGSPELELNDGGIATYDMVHSTATALAFDYTVQAGQNTPDLAISSVNLNGGAIIDLAGNLANLAGAVANPAGTLQIDTVIPTCRVAAISNGKHPNISGSTEAGCELWVSYLDLINGHTGYLGSTTAASDGSWSVTTSGAWYNLNDPLEFAITATDGAGNVRIIDNFIGPANDETFVANACDDYFDITGDGDTFVFHGNTTGGNGNDVIADFGAHSLVGPRQADVIQFDPGVFSSFAALLADTRNNAAGEAVISYMSGGVLSTLTLDGVHRAQLTAADFHL